MHIIKMLCFGFFLFCESLRTDLGPGRKNLRVFFMGQQKEEKPSLKNALKKRKRRSPFLGEPLSVIVPIPQPMEEFPRRSRIPFPEGRHSPRDVYKTTRRRGR